jgi:hypothetical protein
MDTYYGNLCEIIEYGPGAANGFNALHCFQMSYLPSSRKISHRVLISQYALMGYFVLLISMPEAMQISNMLKYITCNYSVGLI